HRCVLCLRLHLWSWSLRHFPSFRPLDSRYRYLHGRRRRHRLCHSSHPRRLLMQRNILAGLFGLIFGAGIAISGMINPAKVLNFFDIAGSWDPSLLLVMGSALTVTATGYRFVLRREQP